MKDKLYCPRCGGCDIIASTERLKDGIYRCESCRTQFCPYGGKSSLPAVVASIELDIQGFRKKPLYLKLYGIRGKRMFKVLKDSFSDFVGKLSDEVWNEMAEKLFNEIFLDKWKSNYFDPQMVDGTTWTLTVRFEKKHVLSFHGCNGFPIYWNEMMTIFEPLFAQADASIKAYLQ